ncbi:hypothetical protein AAMO2058_000941000 [Amorphochlora amoebiformis]
MMGAGCCSADGVQCIEPLNKPTKLQNTIRIIGNYGLNEHYDSIKRAKSSMQLQCELQAEVERKWKSHLGYHPRGRLPLVASTNVVKDGDAINTFSYKTKSTANETYHGSGPNPTISIFKSPSNFAAAETTTKLNQDKKAFILKTTRIWPLSPTADLFGGDDIIQLASEGIPSSLRKDVWTAALRVHTSPGYRHDFYWNLVQGFEAPTNRDPTELPADRPSPETPGTPESPQTPETPPGRKSDGFVGSRATRRTNDARQIWIDVLRTLPHHPVLHGDHKYAKRGRESLYKILMAFTTMPDQKIIGYVQGMNLLAGMLLVHIGEEAAFYGLRRLFSLGLGKLYVKGFGGLIKLRTDFVAEMKKRLFTLHAHLKSIEINAGMYTTSWFLTCFIYNVNVHCAANIWDVMLASGERLKEFLIGFGISIMEHLKTQLLKSDFETAVQMLINLPVQPFEMPKLCRKAARLAASIKRRRTPKNTKGLGFKLRMSNTSFLLLPSIRRKADESNAKADSEQSRQLP